MHRTPYEHLNETIKISMAWILRISRRVESLHQMTMPNRLGSKAICLKKDRAKIMKKITTKITIFSVRLLNLTENMKFMSPETCLHMNMNYSP